MNPSREVMVVGTANDVVDVEVTIKRNKSQKRTSSTNSKSVQKPEKKESSNSKTEPKWREILGKQNVTSLKEAQSHKKDIKLSKTSNMNVKDKQKNKNLEDRPKKCCSSSIIVHDRAVQSSDSVNRFEEFGAHILSSLVEGLKVKKDEPCDVAMEMEKLLSKNLDSGKRSEVTETKLETRAQSKEYMKKMKTMYEKWSAEKKELQREIEKQDAQLKEVKKEKGDLKNVLRELTQELEETKHKADDKSKTIEQQIEKIKALEQQIENQKSILDEKLPLLQETLIKSQYLTAERDQYAALSRYQDERIAKYQNTMKELQNQIVVMANLNEGNTSPQTSVTHTPGRVFSTPNSSFSDCSDKSWHDLSDVSPVKQITQSKSIQSDVAPLDVSLLDEESSPGTTDS